MAGEWFPTEPCENCGHDIEIIRDDYLELSYRDESYAFCELNCLKQWINSPEIVP